MKANFGQKPTDYTSLLEKADLPEIDMTEELNQAGIKVY
jgi:hypothetical protein